MSRIKNQELGSWVRWRAQLAPHRANRSGEILSVRDNKTYQEALLLLVLVIDDLSTMYSGIQTRGRNFQVAISLASQDVLDVAAFLSEVVLTLRGYHVPGSMTYSGFKHQMRKYPFSGHLLASCRGCFEDFFETCDPATFSPLYQVFSFLSHLSLRDIEDTAKLEEEYLATESRLRNHKYPPSLMQNMRQVISEWFQEFSISDRFLPYHGPGSTAQTRKSDGKLIKYLKMGVSPNLCRLGGWKAGMDVPSYVPFNNEAYVTRDSKVQFVPKSLKTRRVISKEPVWLMYFQEGVEYEVVNFISRHPYLSSRIDLNDQSIQGDLALQASRTRSHATVDLSAASDTVSYELVRTIFADSPLAPWLDELRSYTAVLPSGARVDMAKFAPMGSALCFPIETIVFAAVCECTSRYVYSTSGERLTHWRVYGDDIIVPEGLFEDLLVNLRWCGFSVNTDKTYNGDHLFRESCGTDAYDGVLVTPMKISRNFSADPVTSHSPALWMCLIDMANNAYRFGFSSVRRWIIHRLAEGDLLPEFSNSGEVGLISTEPTNFHLPKRWDQDWQTYVYRVPTIELVAPSSCDKCTSFSTCQKRLDTERARYFEWLRTTSYRTNTPGVTGRFDIVEPCIIKNDTPLSRSCRDEFPYQGDIYRIKRRWPKKFGLSSG